MGNNASFAGYYWAMQPTSQFHKDLSLCLAVLGHLANNVSFFGNSLAMQPAVTSNLTGNQQVVACRIRLRVIGFSHLKTWKTLDLAPRQKTLPSALAFQTNT